MYLDFYGFKEPPFSIAPNPRYLYMSPQHQEALAHLLFSLETRGGFVLLTGEVGTGKTTITRCFLEKIPQDTELAYVLHPKLSAEDLMAAICDELGIKYDQASFTVKNYVDVIYTRLLETYSTGKRTFLVIDEAQNLSINVLEQIRLLTNLETSESKLLQIILIGQPELREIFSRTELRQLNQRITARSHIEQLTEDDITGYVKHRLRIAGGRHNPFSEQALKLIYRFTGGIPRLVNVLCDRALLGGYVREVNQINSQLVIKAASEVFGKQKESKFFKLPKILSENTVFALPSVKRLSLLSVLFLFGSFSLSIWLNFLRNEGPSFHQVASVTKANNTEFSNKEIANGLTPELEQIFLELSLDEPSVLAERSTMHWDSTTIRKKSERNASYPIFRPGFDGHTVQAEAKNLADSSVSNLAGNNEISKVNSVGVLGDDFEAYQRLIDAWGLDYKVSSTQSLSDICSRIYHYQLGCLRKNGDLDALRGYNRPALIKVDLGDKSAFVTIVSIQDELVSVASGARGAVWETKFLQEIWSGDFIIFWREPSNYKGASKVGASGDRVKWLSQKLALLDEKTRFNHWKNNPEKKLGIRADQKEFDEKMEQAVKILQAAQGLTVDGIVGVNTLISINTLLDSNLPTLQPVLTRSKPQKKEKQEVKPVSVLPQALKLKENSQNGLSKGS